MAQIVDEYPHNQSASITWPYPDTHPGSGTGRCDGCPKCPPPKCPTCGHPAHGYTIRWSAGDPGSSGF